jgi:DNA-binding NarL/FixJ family response regulator
MSQAPAAAPPLRVLIADDQTLFRSGLALLLGRDSRVSIVGEAANGVEAVEIASRIRPDVVLMDIRMPEMDGIEATRRIVDTLPDVKVLVLSTLDADNHVIQALSVGASGYVLKDASPEAVVSSLLAVVQGGHVFAREVSNHVLDLVAGHAPSRKFYDGLTAREIEVLKLVASGLANKRIAFSLKISEKTVRNHVSHMYEKLGIVDRSQAVLYAVRKGLIEA